MRLFVTVYAQGVGVSQINFDVSNRNPGLVLVDDSIYRLYDAFFINDVYVPHW